MQTLRAASFWKWTLPAPATGGTSVEHFLQFLHPLSPSNSTPESQVVEIHVLWVPVRAPQCKVYLCGTSLCATLGSAKSKLLFCYLKDIKCGEVGVPGRANVFWWRNKLSQISFHFHCDLERLSEMQNPPCPFLSKPEHIILNPTHAKSLHSKRNLFLPPTGGACVDLAGCLEGPPSPLPFLWKSGTSSMGSLQMNIPLALFRNIRQQGLKLSDCIFS